MEQPGAYAERQNALLHYLSELQNRFLLEEPTTELFERELGYILELSESKMGFIGESKTDENGELYLRTLAISNISWNQDTVKLYEERRSGGLDFRNLSTLFGHVLKSGEVMISNNPEKDSRAGGTPEGHPALSCFLGLPICVKGELIGMLGLANREQGYTEQDVTFLAPLCATLGTLMKAIALEQDRKKALQELETKNNSLRELIQTIDDIIFEFDAELCFREVYTNSEEMLFFKKEDFLGKQLQELPFPKEFLNRFSILFKQVLITGNPISEEYKSINGEAWYFTKVLRNQRSDGSYRLIQVIRDITDKKKSEQEIQQAEQTKKLALRAARQGSWTWNLTNNHIVIDERYREIYGYEQEVIEDLLSFWTNSIHPEDREKVDEILKASLDHKQKALYRVEYRGRKKDGTYAWMLTQGDVLERGPEGQALMMAGTLMDITARKEAEEALATSQANLQTLIDNTTEFIWSINMDYQLTSFNKNMKEKAEKYYNFSLELGANVKEMSRLAPELAEWEKCYTRALQGESVNYRFAFEQQGVAVNISEYSFNPIKKDNAIIGVSCASKNITELVLHQRELERAKNVLERALRSLEASQRLARIGTWEATLPEKEVYWSPMVHELFGLYNQALSFDEAFSRFKPTTKTALRQMFDTLYQFYAPFEIELELETYDRGWIWVRNLVEPILKEGVLIGIRGSMQDITLEKQAALELLKAKEAAEQAAKAKAEFLSVMSHEIRTPLNGVIGYTHLLMEDNPKPEQLDSLNSLLFSAENLLALVNDILDFSRIDNGMVALEKIPFNLRELLENITRTLQPKVQEKKLKLYFNIDPATPKQLTGDATRLSQVITNLLSNAIKFTLQGEVQLLVSLLHLDESMATLHFQVKDTGIGIPKEQHQHIFDKFSQAESSTARRFGGSGLGLAIVKKILELMNSEIQLQSEPGKGSNFSFRISFPVSQQEEHQPAKASPTTREQNLQAANILIAEDNEMNAFILKNFLQRWNARVTWAKSGEEVLELCQNQSFDLILMDLQMPEKDGLETSTLLRQRGWQSPIIALTADALPEIVERVKAAGMNDLMTKPFNPTHLNAQLIRWLHP